MERSSTSRMNTVAVTIIVIIVVCGHWHHRDAPSLGDSVLGQVTNGEAKTALEGGLLVKVLHVVRS